MIFNPVVKIFEAIKSILIEIVNRPCTDRDLHLIFKMILDSIIGDQLILGHIHGIDLYTDTVLHRSADAFRKRSHMPVALTVFENFGPPFRYHGGNVNIDDLPGFISDAMIPAFRQTASINRYFLDFIRSINLLQGDAIMSWLTTGFAITICPWFPWTKAIG